MRRRRTTRGPELDARERAALIHSAARDLALAYAITLAEAEELIRRAFQGRS